jgi:hypothetical protein
MRLKSRRKRWERETRNYNIILVGNSQEKDHFGNTDIHEIFILKCIKICCKYVH